MAFGRCQEGLAQVAKTFWVCKMSLGQKPKFLANSATGSPYRCDMPEVGVSLWQRTVEIGPRFPDFLAFLARTSPWLKFRSLRRWPISAQYVLIVGANCRHRLAGFRAVGIGANP
jgi:hypothetical protein